MPPAKYYATIVGRNGPAIYTTPEAYRDAMHGVSGASGKSFTTASQARRWLIGRLKSMSYGFCMLPSSDTLPILPVHGASLVLLPPSLRPKPQKQPDSPPLNLESELASADPTISIQPLVEQPPQFILSPEQQCVLDMVKAGQNVFFTGPAGTGKSVLLKEIIKAFKSEPGKEDSLAITASTGVAGLNIGGSTIHSFAGIGLGKEPVKELVLRITESKGPLRRWKTAKALIIDEISILDGRIFDKLEAIARGTRRGYREKEEHWDDKDFFTPEPGEKPFGGIQLILSGDFCQLPPVGDKSYDHILPATFAFDSRCWKRCISSPVLLTQVFRQRDNEFIEILSAMRVGRLLPHHIKALERLDRPLIYSDGIEASELYPLRAQVEACNNRRLNALDTPIFTYRAMDSAGYGPYGNAITPCDAERLLDRSMAPGIIDVRVGAQVMLLRNIEQGQLVNGSVGRIIDFLTVREAFQRKVEVAREATSRAEAPKRMCRVKSMQELPIPVVPEPPTSMRPLSDHFFKKDEKWPLVKFTNGRELLCAPLEFPIQGFMGNVEAFRIQVPLILAWALSIHKSQGQTLSRVKVNLGRIFEKGQAYVALSRATSMEGLEIKNFDAGKVQAHPRVIAWQATWTPALNAAPTKMAYTTECREPDTMDWDEMDSEEAITSYHSNLAIYQAS